MAEQVATQATDIWTIIGLSSLIASVVTVVLGLARDVLVERYRFKRQSEAAYLQSQIQIFSRLHFLIFRMRIGAVGNLFKNVGEAVKEVNTIIETNLNLLPSIIVADWLETMALLETSYQEPDDEKKAKQIIMADEKFGKILDLLEQYANKYLIPRYRKFVGKTVTELHRHRLDSTLDDKTHKL